MSVVFPELRLGLKSRPLINSLYSDESDDSEVDVAGVVDDVANDFEAVAEPFLAAISSF